MQEVFPQKAITGYSSRQTTEDKLVDLKLLLEKSKTGTEAFAISCAREASWEADIIILATPYGTEKEVAEKIREVATGKVVISISNPPNSSYNDLVSSPDTSAAEELQKLLPNSKVVKTFNTTLAADFMTPAIDGKTSEVFIAGNNSDAVDTVSEIVKTAGFNPIVVGDLTVSRTLERMQLMLIQRTMKVQLQLISGMENTSSLKTNHMKDRLKSYIALGAFVVLCIWMLARIQFDLDQVLSYPASMPLRVSSTSFVYQQIEKKNQIKNDYGNNNSKNLRRKLNGR